MANPVLTHTTKRPTQSLSLNPFSDEVAGIETNRLDLQLVRLNPENGQPVNDNASLTVSEYPGSAIQINTGGDKYSNRIQPYQAASQDDMSGGRASDVFENDKSRYLDGENVLTQSAGQVTLGGEAHWARLSYNGADMVSMPVDDGSELDDRQKLYDSTRYTAVSFVPTSSYTTDRVVIIAGWHGAVPGNLRAYIYSNTAGNPNAVLATATLTSSTVTEPGERHLLLEFASPLALTFGTTYWLVLYSVTNGTSTNHWACRGTLDVSAPGRSSSDGASWNSDTFIPFFIIGDQQHGSATHKIRFFEYAGSLYIVSFENATASVRVIRTLGKGVGVASNSQLVDSAAIWTTNMWAGGVVVLVSNAKWDEDAPWRTITSNNGTTLTLDRAWDSTSSRYVEYVILGEPEGLFTSVRSFTSEDFGRVVVAGKFTYIFDTADTTGKTMRFREYDNAGTQTPEHDSENINLQGGAIVRDPVSGEQLLYGFYNELNSDYPNHSGGIGPAYCKMHIPPEWGDLYRNLGELVPTDRPWDALAVSNVTQSFGFGTTISIAGGFSTGIISAIDLDEPLLINEGTHIGVHMKSTRNMSSSDLHLVLNTQPYYKIAGERLADYVFHKWKDRYEVCSAVYNLVPSTGSYTDMPLLYDGLDDTSVAIPMDTTYRITLVSSKKFNNIQANIDTANATAARTISLEYFNGEEFVDHSGSITGNFGGTTAFGSTGKQTVSFPLPGDWEQTEIGGVTGYAMTILVNAAIDAGTKVKEFAVRNTEVENYTRLSNTNNANDQFGNRVNFRTDDRLIVGMASDRFSQVNLEFGSYNADADADLSTVRYFNGDVNTTIGSVTDGTADGNNGGTAGTMFSEDGSISWTVPDDWQRMTVEGVVGYFAFIGIDEDMTDDILIEHVTVNVHNVQYDLNLGAFTADIWRWVSVSLGTLPTGNTEDVTIRSAYLRLDTNLAAQDLIMRGGVRLTNTNPAWRVMPDKANGIVAYGTDLIEPYIFFEGTRPHRIDILNNDALVPVRITGFENLKSTLNGRASAHIDVHLYFSLGEGRLERYFDGSLEDVGPDREWGLPYDRQGIVTDISDYIGGRVIVVVGGDVDRQSAIFERVSSGWHELWRAPLGMTINDLQIQVVPGPLPDRLWFDCGGYIVWIPLPSSTTNVLRDTEYVYAHAGRVITGYITGGAWDTVKLFKSVKIFCENVGGDEVIELYYRVDDNATWLYAGEFDTTGFDELDLSTSYVSGRRIQLMFVLRRGSRSETPVLKAWTLNYIEQNPSVRVFSCNVRIDDMSRNLADWRTRATRAETMYAALRAGRNAVTPYRMNLQQSPHDEINVVINRIGSRATYVNAREQEEIHFVNLELLELG